MREKSDIDFALVESKRPPIYTAMKYWGKKPHNIWREYIENYTPKDGIFLDPFSGSGISVFEAAKCGRKAISFDLNPLTSFIHEVWSSSFDLEKFENKVEDIIKEIEKDKIFIKYFSTNSRFSKEKSIVQSFKWKNGSIYELGVFKNKKEIEELKTSNSRYLTEPNENDHFLGESQNEIKIDYWYPNESFIKSPSFSENFLNNIGGNNFSNLWTKRNLYVISKIFHFISKEEDVHLKNQLLFGFIQTIHLCTKMSVPRRAAANRPFSTSWGRSAYICSSRQMEMNPLYVFKRNCIGRQSVKSCLSNIENYLGKIPKSISVGKNLKNKNKLSGFDIKYGTVDINAISDYIPAKSIDFIMTDPPYGGLVQYLDLSTIWLNWLKNIDLKYTPNYDAEITIKKDIIGLETYKSRFTNSLKNLHKVLKDDGKIVFTFHNKEISVWNAFLKSITMSGFKIEKVIHQQNRRTGEANVANPYGTSGTDFYIRCVKSPDLKIKNEIDEFEHFVINKAIQIIASRNEPTPFLILFNGLLTEISSAGFDLEDFDKNIQSILNEKLNSVFTVKNNKTNKAGNYWWFVNPSKHIKYPDKKLIDRVEETVISFLRRKNSITFDDAIGVVFKKYPNGLTPDLKSITSVLEKYAKKSNGRWLYNASEVEKEFTKHTEIIYMLIKIGHMLGFKCFVGKREQPEPIKNKKLSDFCDYTSLKFLIKNITSRKRIEMIDLLWMKNDIVKYAIEVENSTNFMSGIQRASNLDKKVNKFMIIPNQREKELKRISDPLFVDSFKEHSWKYLTYNNIDSLFREANLTLINNLAADIN